MQFKAEHKYRETIESFPPREGETLADLVRRGIEAVNAERNGSKSRRRKELGESATI